MSETPLKGCMLRAAKPLEWVSCQPACIRAREVCCGPESTRRHEKNRRKLDDYFV